MLLYQTPQSQGTSANAVLAQTGEATGLPRRSGNIVGRRSLSSDGQSNTCSSPCQGLCERHGRDHPYSES
jgi:hypothetical protein